MATGENDEMVLNYQQLENIGHILGRMFDVACTFHRRHPLIIKENESLFKAFHAMMLARMPEIPMQEGKYEISMKEGRDYIIAFLKTLIQELES